MKGDREEIFEYIFAKADEVGYMGLDSARSGKFQDELENDSDLIKIAGEKLSRKYIKDTVLNNYSKKQRYISEADVLNVFFESKDIEVLGVKKDLENGLFTVKYEDSEFESTSSSINEWQTVLKKFGKKSNLSNRFAFLTCGGVEKSKEELDIVIDILYSYDVSVFIVKPSQGPVSIKSYIRNVNRSKSTVIEKAKLSKSFLLLAGISGTGKTRFVREQAKSAGNFNETYCLTSVRPDWHEPSDLLGYISRLNGQAEYVTTDILKFIAKAWRGIADAGLKIEAQAIDDQGERLVVGGDSGALQTVLAYWLCLDEMNLAPVEQYFADYLSVLETREWSWDGDAFTYSSDALLKPATIKEVADTGKLRTALGFTSSNYDDLWQLICKHGLSIPFNLMVAGTVNMDETTHGFSRKVIDRALSFDFGEFFPNNYDEFFIPNSHNKALSYPIWSQARKEDLAATCDTDGTQTLAFLTAVNSVLKNTPFELAYRALNELLLAVVSSQPQNELTLKAVWDDFMMCKVLPRIEGDSDKLCIPSTENSLLQELVEVLHKQLAPIWHEAKDSTSARPDLYRERIVADGVPDEDKIIRIACRSKGKLDWMIQRLAIATFTSFWP